VLDYTILHRRFVGMNNTIQTKLTEAQASAVMIVANAFSYAGSLTSQDGYGVAITAVVTAENCPSPQTNYAAENACKKFLEANEEAALAAINDRIGRRQASAAAPLGQGAKRALRGED